MIGTMYDIKLNLRNVIVRHRGAVVAWVVLAVLFAGAGIFASGFLSEGNMRNLGEQMLPVLLSSLGQMAVILTGGLDLSVGALASVTTAILVLDLPLFVKLPIVFLLAILVGAINGYGIAGWKIHPIVMTMGMMSMLQGLTFLLLPIPGGRADELIVSMATGSFLGIPAPAFWALGAIGVAYWFIHRSWFGLHLIAIGGEATYAGMNGARVVVTTVKAYIYCSVSAVLVGTYLTGRLASGDPWVGDFVAIDSIVAAVLGGAALSGGVGTVIGTVAGTVLLSISANSLNLLNVPPFYQFVLKGGLLIGAVSLFRRKERGL